MGLQYDNAPAHVFKIIYVSHGDLLAWSNEYGWTQLRRGDTYTFEEALITNLPLDGRWYAIGELIYSVE